MNFIDFFPAISLLKDYSMHLDHGRVGKEQGGYNANPFVYTNNPHLVQNHLQANNPGANQPFGETLKSINLSAGQNRNEFLDEKNKKGTLTNEKREEIEYVIKRESSDISREDMIDYEEARIDDVIAGNEENVYGEMIEGGNCLHHGHGVKREKKKELIIQPIEVRHP